MISKFDIWVSRNIFYLNKVSFSLITIFSFLGITLGVATLIIVMSVMNGLERNLQKRS